ncbi:hypothetical protein NDU88_000411 [Pleurodeles waltl]|uniref:Uncharacterized protein n=1 Tax=Pleurodeles waltl TaxID=8319 RepID=A0AAV7LW78_PLEWA|nr:hypothetical protein NDU88_000411 [Pleurodeles waltl]
MRCPHPGVTEGAAGPGSLGAPGAAGTSPPLQGWGRTYLSSLCGGGKGLTTPPSPRGEPPPRGPYLPGADRQHRALCLTPLQTLPSPRRSAGPSVTEGGGSQSGAHLLLIDGSRGGARRGRVVAPPLGPCDWLLKKHTAPEKKLSSCRMTTAAPEVMDQWHRGRLSRARVQK